MVEPAELDLRADLSRVLEHLLRAAEHFRAQAVLQRGHARLRKPRLLLRLRQQLRRRARAPTGL